MLQWKLNEIDIWTFKFINVMVIIREFGEYIKGFIFFVF